MKRSMMPRGQDAIVLDMPDRVHAEPVADVPDLAVISIFARDRLI